MLESAVRFMNYLDRTLNKGQPGFTIVEMIIAFALAGLVLAILLLVVPALRSNTRNTLRRSDLANLQIQFNAWVNKNGRLPGDSTTTDGLEGIVGSIDWVYYKGDLAKPKKSIISRTTVTAISCTPSTYWTDLDSDGTIQSGECAFPGVFTAVIIPATLGRTAEYTVGYVRNLDPGFAPAFLYPNRQEIHIFGEYACSDDMLAGGNDTDNSGANTYAPNDLVKANARALAFVYQIEGGGKASCKDNA